jgi:hypothetical protein
MELDKFNKIGGERISKADIEKMKKLQANEEIIPILLNI